MSTLEDRKAAVTGGYPLSEKTARALADIEQGKLKRERNGALIGIAAGGFGKSVSSGRLGTVIRFTPLVMGAGFGVLAIYALLLSLS